MSRTTAFITAIFGPLMLLVASSLPAQNLPFATSEVRLASMPRERFFDGTVEAVNQATMSAQTAGRVAEILYDVDDYVEAGAPILRFTDVEQQAALRQAQAALREALALANQSDEDFRRIADLVETGVASKREYDQALAGREAAAARVSAAQSAVATAEQQLEYTLVRAPYAGIVTERHVEVGEAVGIGQPLMSGLSLEALRVVVDLPQQAAALVRNYRQASILTAEGRVEALGMTIFPFAHTASNTFRVRVELPQGQFSLYPGMFVKVAFLIGESERLLVPSEALLRRSEVTGVYVVGPDNAVRMRQIRIGNSFAESTEILSGLREGERVALDPVAAGIYVKTTVAKSGANDSQ